MTVSHQIDAEDPPESLVLANATLVLPDETVTGSIEIAGGRIVDVQPGAGVPPGAIDCGGDHVAPAQR